MRKQKENDDNDEKKDENDEEVVVCLSRDLKFWLRYFEFLI